MTPEQKQDSRLELAVKLHRAGRLDEARKHYQKIIEAGDPPADAFHNLGTLLAFRAEFTGAIELVEKAIFADPENLQYRLSYAELHYLDGNPSKAVDILNGLSERLGRAQAKSGSCGAPMSQRDQDHGQIAKAAVHALMHAVLRHNPPPSLLAPVLQMLTEKNFVGAVNFVEPLTARFPNGSTSWLAYGTALYHLNRLTDALNALQKAYLIAPEDPEVLNTFGVALKANGQIHQSIAILRHAVAIAPNEGKAWSNLGASYLELGLFADAVSALQRACQCKPVSIESLNNLSVALRHTGNWTKAEIILKKIIEEHPHYQDAINNLAVVFRESGELTQALSMYKALCTLSPTNWAARSNWLFASQYEPTLTHIDLKHLAEQFGISLRTHLGTMAPHHAVFANQARNAATKQRLRVGFVSADLRNHPVAYFLTSLLANQTEPGCEWFAYSNSAIEDDMSQHLRSFFSKWQMINGLTDESAAELIRSDDIDVLVDLSGHTALNRLALFARRCAPLQLTWLGYYATTGLSEIDAMISDVYSTPSETTEWFSERLIRLPTTRLCFSEPVESPTVNDSPVARNGFITFGSFQHLTKIGDHVLRLWGEVLKHVTGSVIRIQARQFVDAGLREKFLARCEKQSIDPDRVYLLPPSDRLAYLSSYHHIDIVLDTFPFPGGTTTCEALWMGVPTLTLVGDRMISRQGGSLLNAAGLTDWIATSERDYIQTAISQASDMDALKALRGSLRDRLSHSALMNHEQFAADWIGAVRALHKQLSL
ncbi:MAG: hypothetical protein EBS54_03320 [Betaproteobacteria bacterium]|nr:hypothetical protein [Betaproteobacteria bacterium]